MVLQQLSGYADEKQFEACLFSEYAFFIKQAFLFCDDQVHLLSGHNISGSLHRKPYEI